MKPSKIEKVGRRLYIYFKIPFYSSFKKMYYKLQKYYDNDSSLEPFIDKTRSKKDIEPYLKVR